MSRDKGMKPAPFQLTPQVVNCVLAWAAQPATGIAQVPIEPVQLVDQPRRSENPTLAKANDDTVDILSTVSDWPDAPLPDGYVSPDSHGIKLPTKRNAQRTVRDAMHVAAKDRDARSLEAPVDKICRMDQIRRAAERLQVAPAIPPRPAIGAPVARKAIVLPPLAAEVRAQRLQGAIAFLKRKGVLVSVTDRDAKVRMYRVSGRAESKLAEEVIAIAIERGMDIGAVA